MEKYSVVHGSEKLILLQYPYYTKSHIDLMKTLSKFQW